MNDAYDFLRLTLLPKIGPTRGRALAARFASWDELCGASLRGLLDVPGFQDSLARNVFAALRSPETRGEIDAVIERSARLAAATGAEIITFDDARFPECVRRIYDPPLFLFMNGAYSPADERAVAIVGTRAASEYGKRVATQLGREFAECGVTVVSGLALGIDTVAHHAAVIHNGRSIAVLGSGLANIYPPSNRLLFEKLVKNGCVFSEFAMDAAPDAQNFPRRNRIISGLALATIVVESGIKGGAIITARMALDQDRDVFAVPGSIFHPASTGSNMLLKRGTARVCTRAQDVLDEVPLLTGSRRVRPRPAVQLSFSEQKIVETLGEVPKHIDDIAIETAFSPAELLVQLLSLEFAGVVRQLPGKHFTLT